MYQLKKSEIKLYFLRKLEKGGSKHSFGIHVARMSGMPKTIIDRAYEVMEQLEQKMHDKNDVSQDLGKKLKELETKKAYQLSIFDSVDETGSKLKEELNSMNINSMTPIECMIKLNELKKIIEDQD